MERLDIKIPKELKDKLIALKTNKGINYSAFIENAIIEKFERLNNPEKFIKENSDKTQIINELRELKRSHDLLKIDLMAIKNVKETFEKGETSKDLEILIEKQLNSKLYNGNNIIPKSTKAIFERLEKDGYKFPLEVVSSTLFNSFKYVKKGKLEGWILREGEVNGK